MSSIWDESIEILDSSNNLSPAAAALIPSFLNCAIGTRLPDHSSWVAAYKHNPKQSSYFPLLKARASPPNLKYTRCTGFIVSLRFMANFLKKTVSCFSEIYTKMTMSAFGCRSSLLLYKILHSLHFNLTPLVAIWMHSVLITESNWDFSGLICSRHVRNWQNVAQVVPYLILQNGQWATSSIPSLLDSPWPFFMWICML